MWALLSLTFSFTECDNSTETYKLINSTNLAKQGCESRCGDLIVPYPFGFGNDTSCSIDEGFHIYCNKSVHPHKASFSETSPTWIKAISDSTLRRSNLLASNCSFPDGSWSSYNISSDYTLWPFTISKVNKFTVIGCDSYAWLTSATTNKNVSTGCLVFCSKPDEVGGLDECSGNGCCQSSIPQDITSFTTRVNSLLDSGNLSDTRWFAPCTYAFVGEENVFNFSGITDLKATDVNDTRVKDKIESTVPVVLEWAIGKLSCAEANGTKNFACQSNSICINSTREAGGYRCACKEGYQGNPYLSPGCQDIDECTDPKKIPCYGNCVNTIGNYTCTCKGGFFGDAKVENGCQPRNVALPVRRWRDLLSRRFRAWIPHTTDRIISVALNGQAKKAN
ncbi:hypothetical protein SSX86_007387 [Deinandra increscens subsp. villosa]|uniref:EGF-like domain-containing protein n=1 Tax=Deinandra increscens subsp. villosa TaxID=3103831 RepID=A0AAP0H7V5_9ASTR